MDYYLCTLHITILLAIGGSIYASPTFDNDSKPRKELLEYGVQRLDEMSKDNQRAILDKLGGVFDNIIQEMVEAERLQKEYQVNIQESDFHSEDLNKLVRSVLLTKMKQMHEAMEESMQYDVHQQGATEHRHITEMDALINSFLYNKIIENQERKEDTFYRYNNGNDDSHADNVQIMSDASTYLPIYKFDRAASEYCFPDQPSAQNDNKCVKTLNKKAPVYYEVDTCEGQTVYTYWLWYGLQEPCIAIFDEGHGNDWEHVSVYVNPSDGRVSKVVFHQHGGHYTRRRGTYTSEGERPIVYIGKIAHGSYHIDCNGQCSFTELFSCGCYGCVRFCIGGCLYWDDFRNPGPELRDATLHPLNEGQVIDGINRPDRKVCGIGTCEGSDKRFPADSGCWQDKP